MSSKNPYISNPSTEFKPVDTLDKESAREQVEALTEAIDYHDHRYYIQNDPVIADRTYDKLFKRLEDLEEAFPDLASKNSPTRRVGAPPVDELTKREHRVPMLSLESALEQEEVERFDRTIRKQTGDRRTYVVEPKLDGLSVEVVYENGRFSYGVTRGDGRTGEDVSENLKTIHTLPLRLQSNGDLPALLAVRGEVLMSKSGFQTLNKTRIERGEDPFANPRNAAAGTMRQLNSKHVADKPLEIYFYDLLDSRENGFEHHWDILNAFQDWGLRTHPANRRCSSLEDVHKAHQDLAGQREEMDIDIDGVVIKLDDLAVREELGTRERNPRWAIAWKFPPKKEVTTLEDIVVQVGRTGMLTPVALLDPVDIGGVTVSRATLHNEDEVHSKDVRKGDTVRVIRAGDVIPEVAERVKEPGRKRGPEFSMPDHCPVCGSEVVKEGAYTLCPAGLSCPAQLKGRLHHYASRDAMDIENLGQKNIQQLVERERVTDLADLYHLSKEDLQELEGFAEKSARQLYEAIQDAKHPPLDVFLYALGIRHVGRHVARVLAREFHSFEALREAGEDDLQAIPDIGPEIAESIVDFFQDPDNRKTLDRLLDAGVEVQETKASQKKTLEGKTFVFTGELEHYTRDEAQDKVESLGGRATSSVSGNTDYLVVGENPGSKLDDAREQGVEVVDEEGFEALIGQG